MFRTAVLLYTQAADLIDVRFCGDVAKSHNFRDTKEIIDVNSDHPFSITMENSGKVSVNLPK